MIWGYTRVIITIQTKIKMKKLFLVLFLISNISFVSCTLDTSSLQGNYKESYRSSSTVASVYTTTSSSSSVLDPFAHLRSSSSVSSSSIVTNKTSSLSYLSSVSSYNVQKDTLEALGPINHYTNVNGETVQSPTLYNQRPSGASAQCKDGTYSFSKNRRGTCSGHGGVAEWY